jgi:branched-chain amino acid transport system substrate-binding protein
MKTKKETTVLLLSFLFTGALLLLGYLLYDKFSGKNPTEPTPDNTPKSITNPDKATRVSRGEQILVTVDTNPDKQAGVEAFAKGDFDDAQAIFKTSLKKNRNDPEALIYLNNSLAAKGNPIKIAVSVPIGGNVNVAKEILRGVAQAQDEVNRNGGINNRLLQVVIGNDDNEPSFASQVAKEFVKDEKIMAVVGHNASNASLAAAPEYQSGGLVMISPTSFSQNLSGFGGYIFRTVPSIDKITETLANHIIKKALKTNIAICEDSRSIDNRKDIFAKAIETAGGKVNPTNCDLAADNFNPNTVISQLISSGADALMLAPHIDRIDKAIELARANKGKLPLFSSPTMYTNQTLKTGKADVNGMVLPTPWHPTAISGNPFPENARKIWGGNVSWRTAMAYDATMVVSKGLQQGKTRQELQKVLRSENFSFDGASGKVQFSPSGDRKSDVTLIKVEPSSQSLTGYDFAPLGK